MIISRSTSKMILLFWFFFFFKLHVFFGAALGTIEQKGLQILLNLSVVKATLLLSVPGKFSNIKCSPKSSDIGIAGQGKDLSPRYIIPPIRLFLSAYEICPPDFEINYLNLEESFYSEHTCD